MTLNEAFAVLVVFTPLLSVLAGVVVAIVWRQRAVARGFRVTALRSIIAVSNGVAVGLVYGLLFAFIGAVVGSGVH